MFPIAVCPSVKVTNINDSSSSLHLKTSTPLPGITKTLQESRKELSEIFFINYRWGIKKTEPIEKTFERENLVRFWNYIGALELLLPFNLSCETNSFTFSVEGHSLQFDSIGTEYAFICCALAGVYERYAAKEVADIDSQEYFLSVSALVLRHMVDQIKRHKLSHTLPSSKLDLGLADAQSELQRTRVLELRWFGRSDKEDEDLNPPDDKLELFQFLKYRYEGVLMGFKETQSGKLLKEQVDNHLRPLIGSVYLEICEATKIVDQETLKEVKDHLEQVPRSKRFLTRIRGVEDKIKEFESQPLLFYDEVSNPPRPDHDFKANDSSDEAVQEGEDEEEDEEDACDKELKELEKKVASKIEENLDSGRERFKNMHKDELLLLESESRFRLNKKFVDSSMSTYSLCAQLLSEVKTAAEKGEIAVDTADDMELVIQKIGEAHRYECRLAAILGRLLEQSGISETIQGSSIEANAQREAAITLFQEELKKRNVINAQNPNLVFLKNVK